MDLLPLIVNPAQKTAPGGQAFAPAQDNNAQPQFQAFVQAAVPPKGKAPGVPANANDSGNGNLPNVDLQNADAQNPNGQVVDPQALAILAFYSQLTPLPQIAINGDSSAANTPLGTEIITGQGPSLSQINLPVQPTGDGETTPKPLAGLILNPVLQSQSPVGLTNEDHAFNSVQNKGPSNLNTEASGFPIPEGFHPVPAKSNVSTAAFIAATQTSLHLASSQADADGPDQTELPIPPVVVTTDLTGTIETPVPTAPGNLATQSNTVEQPDNLIKPITLEATSQVEDQLPPESVQAQLPNQPESDSPIDSSNLQTVATTEDVSSFQPSSDRSNQPVRPTSTDQLSDIQITTDSKPVASEQATEQATDVAPVPNQPRVEQSPANSQVENQPEVAVVQPTSHSQIPTEKFPDRAAATFEQVPAQVDSNSPSQQTPASGVAPRRNEGDRRAAPRSNAPIAPVGFAINPHHVSIQTDLKVSTVATGTDRTDAIGAGTDIPAGDFPGLPFRAIPNSNPVTGSSESIVPVRGGQTPEIVPQLTHAIAASATEHRSLSVELKPEELGHVRIEVTQHAEGMVASIEVERPSTAHLMTDSLSQLRDSLQAAGINIDRIEISTAPPPPTGDSLNSSSQWGRSNSQASTQQEQSGSRQHPEQQSRRTEFRRDESQRPQPSRTRARIRDIDVTI